VSVFSLLFLQSSKTRPNCADPQFGKPAQDLVNGFALELVRVSNSTQQDRIDLAPPDPLGNR